MRGSEKRELLRQQSEEIWVPIQFDGWNEQGHPYYRVVAIKRRGGTITVLNEKIRGIREARRLRKAYMDRMNLIDYVDR